MAKRIKNYKGFTIKENTKRDNSTYKYVAVKDGEIEFEADNIKELEDNIDSY